MECSGKDVLGATGGEADEYLSDKKWIIVTEQQNLVSLMGRKDKNVSFDFSNFSDLTFQGAPLDEHITSLLKEVQQKILDATALKKEELSDIKHIFSLERPKRWSLYQTWCAALRKLMAENLPKQIAEYRLACKEAHKSYEKFDAEIMKMAMIIGATTSGCSRLRPALEYAKPRILVVEEAAEVLEGHIVSAMISSIEQVVMIGDHKQLRPMPAVHVLGTDYGLNISMFERLVERGMPYSQLRYQHRMNTAITELIVRPAFYDKYDSVSFFILSSTFQCQWFTERSFVSRCGRHGLKSVLLGSSRERRDSRWHIMAQHSWSGNDCGSGQVPPEAVLHLQRCELSIKFLCPLLEILRIIFLDEQIASDK